jgi:prepilin-type N-terminal cleavage/methylation domain-containing protein
MTKKRGSIGPRTSGSANGFSLIEMLIVIVVIGIIATIAVSRFVGATKSANEASAVSAIKLMIGAESGYEGGSTAATLAQLRSSNAIDEGFAEIDGGDPDTLKRSGYIFKITTSGTQYVISAIPASTGVVGSGRRRFGADNTGVIFTDSETIDTHYITGDDLRSGTSITFNE